LGDITVADCPSGLQKEHIDAIARLEEKVEIHEKKIDKLDEIRDAVVCIKTYLGFQKEESEKMNVILTQLSCNVNDLSGQVKEVKTNVSDLTTQVKDLQYEFNKSEKKSIIKIDVRNILLKIVKFFILPVGALGGLVGLIIYIISLFK
jgi:chromosome segregation ATPase